MHKRTTYLLLLWCVTFIVGCEHFSNVKPIKGDKLLAEVGDSRLYLSDLEGMIVAMNREDSLAQIDVFVQSWLRRNVVLTEAEEKLPLSIDIDKLVEDYRASLLLHNYRMSLIEESLDTTISPDHLEEYYEAHKEQFLLPTPIVKGMIVVIPDKTPRLERFYRNWIKNDSTAIQAYIDDHATDVFFFQERWTSMDEVMGNLPSDLFNTQRLSKKGDYQKHYGSSEYFIKLTDFIAKNEVAPLSYTQLKIKKVILHNRKKEMLENIEEELFQTYKRANKLKVY